MLNDVYLHKYSFRKKKLRWISFISFFMKLIIRFYIQFSGKKKNDNHYRKNRIHIFSHSTSLKEEKKSFKIGKLHW